MNDSEFNAYTEFGEEDLQSSHTLCLSDPFAAISLDRLINIVRSTKTASLFECFDTRETRLLDSHFEIDMQKSFEAKLNK